MKVKEAIKLAEENGWEFIRTNGDHHIYRKKGRPILVIPGNKSRDIATGTAHKIMKLIKS